MGLTRFFSMCNTSEGMLIDFNKPMTTTEHKGRQYTNVALRELRAGFL